MITINYMQYYDTLDLKFRFKNFFRINTFGVKNTVE